MFWEKKYGKMGEIYQSSKDPKKKFQQKICWRNINFNFEKCFARIIWIYDQVKFGKNRIWIEKIRYCPHFVFTSVRRWFYSSGDWPTSFFSAQSIVYDPKACTKEGFFCKNRAKEGTLYFLFWSFKSVFRVEHSNYCENILARHFSNGFLHFLTFLVKIWIYENYKLIVKFLKKSLHPNAEIWVS
jgi:hypothetical protein